MHPTPPTPIPTLLHLITRLVFGEEYEAPRCVIFSILLIRPPPEDPYILQAPRSLSCRLFNTFRNIEWQGSGRKRSWRNQSSDYPSIFFFLRRLGEITKSGGSRANCMPEFELETLTTRSQLKRKQTQKCDCPVSSDAILKEVALDSLGIRKASRDDKTWSYVTVYTFMCACLTQKFGDGEGCHMDHI